MSDAFKGSCDFKDKCRDITGSGRGLEAAKEDFLERMKELVNNHAEQHNAKNDNEKNPTYDEFYMKRLTAVQNGEE